MKWVMLRLKWWAVGMLNGFLLAATIAYARQIDMTKAGVSLWVFLAVAAAIVLLQAIPAMLLLASAILSLKGRVKEEE